MQNSHNILKINTVVLVVLALFACKSESENTTQTAKNKRTEQSQKEDTWRIDRRSIGGRTQGTTFIVKTSDDSLQTTAHEIDQLLKGFDAELSGYIDTSLIVRFNQNELSAILLDSTRFFQECFLKSRYVFHKTDGAFDPTVMPLVEAWGFFEDKDEIPSVRAIDSIQEFVGFKPGELFVVQGQQRLTKKDSRARLDFNAVAQGQSVDEIAEYLIDKGQENFFIEIGGEIRTKGVNNEGRKWIVGIDVPKEENTGTSKRSMENYIQIDGKGLATSGNYRKFYVKDGKKYSHTIHPKTGQPVDHNLLSATVIAKEASIADAYATAFMAMGVEKAMDFVEQHPEEEIELYLLFQNEEGRIERAYTSGMNDYFYKAEDES